MRKRVLLNSSLLLLNLIFCAFINAQEKVNFEDHILPIFKNSCFDCHNPDKSKADYSLTTFEDAIKGGETGPAVVSKNPEESLLYRLIVRTEKPYMPRKEPKMDDQKIKLIRMWIQQGLLKSSSAKAIVQKKPKVKIADLKPSKGKPKVALKMPKMVNLEPIFKTNRKGQLLAQASNPWSPLVAFSVGNQILLYDINKILLRGIIKFPEGMAYQVRFTRDGKFLFASGGIAGQTGKYALWRVEDGKLIREGGQEFDSILSGDISNDLRFVSTGGSSKLVKIYDFDSGKILHKLKKHNDWVLATEFSPDGVLLASSDRNGGIVVWESQSGQEYCLLNGHKSAVNAISWRADSNFLVSGSEDGNIKLWSLHRRRQIKNWRGHNGGVLWVEYGNDGKIVSCGRDKLVKVWDKNGKLLKQFRHFKDLPLQSSFSSDRKFIIAGDYNGEAAAFNIKNGKLRNRFILNPPSVKEQLATNSSQITTFQSRTNQKKDLQIKIKKNIVNIQKVLNKKKNELNVITKKSKEGGKQINQVELKKKIGVLQKEIKTIESRLSPVVKKRNEINKQLKYLSWKYKELNKQDFYWKSAQHVSEINKITKMISDNKNQLLQIGAETKKYETSWQKLKGKEQELSSFLKIGKKEANELKSLIKKGNSLLEKELKTVSSKLKERGLISAKIYEAEFMKKTLDKKEDKNQINLNKEKELAAKIKSLDDKLNKSKLLVKKITNNNNQLIQKKKQLDARLKSAPIELTKIKKEMKRLNQLLTTPNPLLKSIPIKIKDLKEKSKIHYAKFNEQYELFQK